MNYANCTRMFAGKTMFQPNQIKLIHQHGFQRCVQGFCRVLNVPQNYWQLSHYRNAMKASTDNITIYDATVWKYGDELVAGVKKTLEATGLKP